MNSLGRYERAIANRPKAFVALVLVITLILGYYMSQMESGGFGDDFESDDPVAVANAKVNEDYGTPSDRITILFKSEINVLTRDALMAQIELEELILTSNASQYLVGSQIDPTGLSSPAKLITQAGFFYSSMAQLAVNGYYGDNATPFIGELTGIMLSLTPEERMVVLEGGDMDVSLSIMDLNLSFPPFQPANTESYLAGMPFEDALSFSLSNDYDPAVHEAKDALMVLSMEQELDEELKLELQKELQSLSQDVEDQHSDLTVFTIGDELVNEEISAASGRNIGMLMSLAFGAIIVVLALIYRSGTDTVINLLALLFAVIWVYGIGVLLGYSFNPAIITVPILIMSLGIDYGIHFTLRYREEMRDGHDIPTAMEHSGRTVGFAIFLTTLTTVVGFTSNLISDITFVRQFGVLLAVGILGSFFIMLTFYPAMKVIIDQRRIKRGKPVIKEKKDRDKGWGRAFNKLKGIKTQPEMVCASGPSCINYGLGTGAVAAKKPLVVLLVVGLLTAGGAYGMLQIETRYDFRDFLSEDVEITAMVRTLVDDFEFSSERAYLLVEGDVAQPEVFLSLEGVQEDAMSIPNAVQSDLPESPWQLAQLLSSPQSYNYNATFAAVWTANIDTDEDGQPDAGIQRANIIAVYDSMYEVDPEDARRVLYRDGQDYAGLVIRVPVNSNNGVDGENIDKDLQDAVAPLKDVNGVDEVIVTGEPVVSSQRLQSIGDSQLESVLLALILCLIILTILYFTIKRSFVLGLISITPLFFVLTWTLGAMYYLDIPLNVVTVTIAAITVGLGIDYSIHITQRFLEDTDRLEDGECSICVTVAHTGSALFGSMITTVVGFAILSFSIVPPLAQFGQVTALSILFAFMAAVFVLPTFLLAWYNVRTKREMKKEMSVEPSDGKNQ